MNYIYLAGITITIIIGTIYLFPRSVEEDYDSEEDSVLYVI